jgi:hypothetical protein
MDRQTDLEPGIRPLVEALNATGIVQTFSSCEGHYSAQEQRLVDRNLAYVQFVPAPGYETGKVVVNLLKKLLEGFKAAHGLLPVTVTGYLRFTPVDTNETDETYVLELRPFNRFDPPDQKRVDTDRAVAQLVTVLTRLVAAGAI